MSKVSKKLRNILVVEGSLSKLRLFEKAIKNSRLKLIYVPCTDLVEELDLNFINKYWNLRDFKLYKRVFCARDTEGRFVFGFNNSNYENDLLELVEKFGLDARYNYYMSTGDMFVINKEKFLNGISVSLSETLAFPKNDFSVAKCLI